MFVVPQAERPAAPMEPALPVFSQDEVAKHGSLEAGVWVTYRGGVYDITEFVAMHPGGDKILLAAGGALEPFWALYAVHSQDHVLEILSEYKVGTEGLGPNPVVPAVGCSLVLGLNTPTQLAPSRRLNRPFSFYLPFILLLVYVLIK